MSKEYEIGMSPNVDIQPQSIMDVAPELIKKMYVYHIPKKAGEGNVFFVPGAVTFLGISKSPKMFEPLQSDKGGHYVDVLPNEILQGYLSHSASTSFIGTDLDYQNSMLIYTEQYFPMDRGERFLVTFNEPYDPNKFNKRDQQAYLVNEGKLVTEEFQDLPPEYTQKNADKGSVFSLQPLHVIMDSSPYTKIIPYFSEEKVSFTEQLTNNWYGNLVFPANGVIDFSQIKGYGGLPFSFKNGDEFKVKIQFVAEEPVEATLKVGAEMTRVYSGRHWVGIKINVGGHASFLWGPNTFYFNWRFLRCSQTKISNNQVNYANFKVNKEFLLDKITALGITEDNQITNVELETTNSKMTPWKIFPSDITGKLDLFMDWQDGSSIIPWSVAKYYISSDGNGVLLFDDTEGATNVITKPVATLLSDMVLLTYGFITNFSNIPRNSQGAFDLKYKIGNGNEKINMSAISGQSAITMISGLLDKFTLEYPTEMKGDAGNKVRALVCALSRYIISPASISGGNNRFNEIYLPWYFEIVTPISMTDEVNKQHTNEYRLASPLKIELKSRYYNFENKEILDKNKSIKLSKAEVIKTDYNYVAKELPTVIQQMNLSKAFNPSSINPKDPKELNYILHVPHNSLITVEDLYKQKVIEKKSGTSEYIRDLDLLPPFTFIIDPVYIRDNDGEWGDKQHVGYGWKDDIRQLKLDILNSYHKQFGGSYNSDFRSINITTKELINGRHLLRMVDINETIHSRNLEELDTIPIEMLKFYYAKKICERYGIPFDKYQPYKYFTISLETPDGKNMTNTPGTGFPSGKYVGFEHFVKIPLGDVTIDNNSDWSGAEEANAGNIFLAHYIPRHLGNEANTFIFNTGRQNMDFTKWGMAAGDDVGDDHQKQAAFVVLNEYIAKYIGKSDTGRSSGNKATFNPYGWKLSGLKVTWNRDVQIGGALEGDVILSKEDWKQKLLTASDIISNEHEFSIKPTNQTDAQFINIFEIKGIWGDTLQITNTNSNFINNTKIEFPSRTDETITVLRIAFL